MKASNRSRNNPDRTPKPRKHDALSDFIHEMLDPHREAIEKAAIRFFIDKHFEQNTNVDLSD